MVADQFSAHKAGSMTKVRHRYQQAAIEASQMLALPNMQRSSLLSSQQVALLVSGAILMCGWQNVSAGFHSLESRGLYSLLDIWAVVGASVILGQLAKAIARRAAVEQVLQAPLSDSQHSISYCTSNNCQCSAVQHKKGVPGEVKSLSTAAEQQYTDDDDDGRNNGDDDDDVGQQKKAAQAQAAAELAQYQDSLQRLLYKISHSSAINGPSSDALHQLASQLFKSPVHLCELVDQGGLPVVMSAARSALHDLQACNSRDLQSQQVILPALLQVSWILLQGAHSPAARCSLLMDQENPMVLLSLIKAVMAASSGLVKAQDCILRNLCWTMLLLCEEQQSTAAGEACSASAACRAALLQAEVVAVLQQLVTLQHGAAAGWVAAATLGSLMQLEHISQQHSRQTGTGCTAFSEALLQPDSLNGLAYLLHHQPHLSDRLQGLVYGLLHYLLTYHAPELLQLLVEQQLVGIFASGLPPKLARLLVCQLLSTRGQEVLSGIEAQYELDVPLALAQVIPLSVHVKLPGAPVSHQHHLQQNQQQQHHLQQQIAEIEPANEGLQPEQESSAQAGLETAASVHSNEDVYTDVLACRLLLQHNRLVELFEAFAEELQSIQQQQLDALVQQVCCTISSATAQPGNEGFGNLLPLTCDGVLKLSQHLMSHDLELQAVQHSRGESVDDSSSSSSSSSSGSSVLDAALAAPDESGVYSTIMTGLVPVEQLPGNAAGTAEAVISDAAASHSAGDCEQFSRVQQQLLQLPHLSSTALPVASHKRDTVLFNFGPLEHAVSSASYKQICSSSKIIHSILCSLGKRPKQPVTVFKIPCFTPEANCWVLQWLERWLTTGQLQGFSAQQAAKLWVAADFLQVDGLLVACEDVIMADAADHQQHVDVALELCSRHRAGSLRLRRLVAQTVLRGLRDAEALPGVFNDRLLQLQRHMKQHGALLLPALLAEVRDRLVAVCTVNVGLNADACYDVVG